MENITPFDLGGKYKVDRHESHRLFLLGISSQGFDYYTED